MNTNQQQQQYQRRTFRGRGGPTDRRLPKHNAARRRPPPPSRDCGCSSVPNDADEDPLDIVDANNDDSPLFSRQDGLASSVNDLDVDSALQIIDPVVCLTTVNDNVVAVVDETSPLFKNEIDHLIRRIQNNRKAMSLSTAALANPASYETNILAACLNTITEYRSILRHHGDRMDDVTKRSTGLATFALIQQSLQCGPLAGAKAGYFQRCGSEVAASVRKYLGDAVIDADDAVNSLCFTKKQADAIETWKDNAAKSAASSKPPSKSVLKQRGKAKAAKK